MTSAFVGKTLTSNSSIALKMLDGIVCIYKPLGFGTRKLNKELRHKLCEDLNKMERPGRKEIVQIRRVEYNEADNATSNSRIPMDKEQIVASFGDGNKKIEIVKGLGLADHPLVSGPLYQHEDIKTISTSKISPDVSGVHIIGVNKGTFTAQQIFHSRWLRTYSVSGRFGTATDNFFHTGKVVEKATYGKIKRLYFERFLSSVQSSHQRLSFAATGVPLDSDRAYELASQGLVRPDSGTAAVIYSLVCKEFNLPDFTIEIQAINEDAEYIKRLIHEIGLQSRSVATCTKIHCTKAGPFELQDSLLMKHWNVQGFIDNMKKSKQILKDFKLNERNAWVEATV